MLGNEKQLQLLLSLFTKGSKLTYQKGEYIIRPGESPSHVFYIKSGLVKAFSISKYGEENLLVIRKPQELFPLISALTGEERDIIYQTMNTTTVYRVDKNDFRQFILANTEALYPLIDLITQQYKMHGERILNLEYRSVRERLISFLLTMSKRFGEETSKGTRISAPIRHQDIASSINSSRETTSRELAVLERKGLINHSQSCIILLNEQALRDSL